MCDTYLDVQERSSAKVKILHLYNHMVLQTLVGCRRFRLFEVDLRRGMLGYETARCFAPVEGPFRWPFLAKAEVFGVQVRFLRPNG